MQQRMKYKDNQLRNLFRINEESTVIFGMEISSLLHQVCRLMQENNCLLIATTNHNYIEISSLEIAKTK